MNNMNYTVTEQTTRYTQSCLKHLTLENQSSGMN